MSQDKQHTVGIRFKRAGRIYYFDAGEIELEVSDPVVVEAKQGSAIARVVIIPEQLISDELSKPLSPVLRKASPDDLQKWEEARGKGVEALPKCKELVDKYNLPMKLIEAESNLEGNHITIFFSSPEKVDFRQVSRELASAVKARVEFHQVGDRDAAKLLGGIGKCGYPLCCATFLTEFNPLSIKMAKEQRLSLDAMKISGICGRLLCCLGYESEFYRMMNQKLPKIGQVVTTPMGRASVIEANPLKEVVTVQLESQAIVEVPLAEITPGEETGEQT